jgi:hypothetical protein
VVPYDFVNVARAVTKLLRAIAPRLGVNFHLPKNDDAALDKRLQRLALWSPRLLAAAELRQNPSNFPPILSLPFSLLVPVLWQSRGA